MSTKENKIHTGFRLSKSNIDYIDDLGKSLGLTRTNIVDMMITLLRKDKSILISLIKNQISKKK